MWLWKGQCWVVSHEVKVGFEIPRGGGERPCAYHSLTPPDWICSKMEAMTGLTPTETTYSLFGRSGWLGDGVSINSSSEALRPAWTGKTDCHHQNNRCYGDGDLSNMKQPVHSNLQLVLSTVVRDKVTKMVSMQRTKCWEQLSRKSTQPQEPSSTSLFTQLFMFCSLFPALRGAMVWHNHWKWCINHDGNCSMDIIHQITTFKKITGLHWIWTWVCLPA